MRAWARTASDAWRTGRPDPGLELDRFVLAEAYQEDVDLPNGRLAGGHGVVGSV
jgi:hypothetical protein